MAAGVHAQLAAAEQYGNMPGAGFLQTQRAERSTFRSGTPTCSTSRRKAFSRRSPSSAACGRAGRGGPLKRGTTPLTSLLTMLQDCGPTCISPVGRPASSRSASSLPWGRTVLACASSAPARSSSAWSPRLCSSAACCPAAAAVQRCGCAAHEGSRPLGCLTAAGQRRNGAAVADAGPPRQGCPPSHPPAQPPPSPAAAAAWTARFAPGSH